MNTQAQAMVNLMIEKIRMFKEIEQEELFNQELIKPEKERDIEIMSLFKKQIARNCEELTAMQETLIPMCESQGDLGVAFKLAEFEATVMESCNPITQEIDRKFTDKYNEDRIKKIEEEIISLKKDNINLPEGLYEMYEIAKNLNARSRGH